MLRRIFIGVAGAVTLALGVSCHKDSPATPVPSVTPPPIAPMPTAPATTAADKDARVLAYLDDMAPLIQQVRLVAKNAHTADASKLAAAIADDPIAKNFAAAHRTALARHSLTASDLSALKTTKSLDDLGRKLPGEDTGGASLAPARDQHVSAIRSSLATERKMDCSGHNPPFGCDPTPVGSCDVRPAYTQCTLLCDGAFAACLVGAVVTAETASLGCAFAYAECFPRCGDPC